MYDIIWDSPLTGEVARAAARHAPPNGTIVDLGCGTGLSAEPYTASGRTVLGVDASAGMLRRASRRKRIATAELADAARTALASGIASTVVLGNVLHLHPSPADVLSEAVRILADDGRTIVITPITGVSSDALAAIDHQLGRSWPAALGADQVRRFVALVFRVLGSRPIDAVSVEDAIQLAVKKHSLEILDDVVLFGCQRIVVLQRAGSPNYIASPM